MPMRPRSSRRPNVPVGDSEAPARLRLLERSVSKRGSTYIDTWHRLLDGPRSDIVRLLLSTDEDDVELLKMSPFTTLLNDHERDEVTRRSKLRRAGSR